METKKFVVEIPSDGFFTNYTETLRKLYNEAFILKNHLMPSNLESFSKSMALQAGKKGAMKSFTEEDLIAIAEEINSKFEEYATGGYTDSFRKQGEERYRSKSKILYDTFISLGCEKAAKHLKYVGEVNSEEMSRRIQNNNISSFDEDNPFLEKNVEEKDTIKNEAIPAKKEDITDDEEDTKVLSKSQAEMIKETFNIKDDSLTMANKIYDKYLKVRKSLEDMSKNLSDICEQTSDAETSFSLLIKRLEKVEETPQTDAERVAAISKLIDDVEDPKLLKPVMISLMTKVL